MFEQVGDDLKMSIYGSTDTLTVEDWYVSTNNQVEVFSSVDMQTCHQYASSAALVDQLIQAMATFSANNGNISWSQALATQPNDVETIVSQYWMQVA